MRAWSRDFIVVDGAEIAARVLERLAASGVAWVVIERHGGALRYVFAAGELLGPPTTVPHRDPAMPIERYLDLHEFQASVQHTEGTAPGDAAGASSPAATRIVEVVRGVPHRVGFWQPTSSARPPEPAEGHPSGPSGASDTPGPSHAPGPSDTPDTPDPPARPGPPPRRRGARPAARPSIEPVRAAAPAPTTALPEPPATAAPDEGLSPERFPLIEIDGLLQPQAAVVVVVDLLLHETPQTPSSLVFPEQAADWQALDVGVLLVAPLLVFDGEARGVVQVRRNRASIAARIPARVRADAPAGAVLDVRARFMLGTRLCGSAARRFTLDQPSSPARTADAEAATEAGVELDAAATQPDLSVVITTVDPQQPGRLRWQLVVAPFPGCPTDLEGSIDLGQDPGAEAAAQFQRFANLTPGEHRETIDGFGQSLWQRAPRVFRDVYAALDTHRGGRVLSIQFITDDPYLPWELMSPVRDGRSEGPLAMRHDVARWIGRWRDRMRHRLPSGRLLAMAPHYPSAALARAQAEAAVETLVEQRLVERIPGTRQALFDLFEQPGAARVALFLFSGHGAFKSDSPDASLLKLEGGASVTALEVGRQAVSLGERDGTVVFINACEVGATGRVLGGIGGWADALLARRFGAFIAPLWAVEERDAAQAATELMQRLVVRREPLGAALRALRARGDASPTFWSYLVYGDVHARMAEAAPAP